MKRILALLAVAAIVLLGISQLVQLAGIRDAMVPDPESVVTSFVADLSSKRYENAMRELDDTLQEEIQVQGLQELSQALSQKFGEYQFESNSYEQGDKNVIQYKAHLKTEKQGVQTMQFELERDSQTNLWKISSLEDVKAKAQP
jgi:hypothetical protein